MYEKLRDAPWELRGRVSYWEDDFEKADDVEDDEDDEEAVEQLEAPRAAGILSNGMWSENLYTYPGWASFRLVPVTDAYNPSLCLVHNVIPCH